jgi:hypothetical protein
MDFTPIYKFFAPKGDLLEPPPSSHPILTDGYELCPAFIAMVQEKSFSRKAILEKILENIPYTSIFYEFPKEEKEIKPSPEPKDKESIPRQEKEVLIAKV